MKSRLEFPIDFHFEELPHRSWFGFMVPLTTSAISIPSPTRVAIATKLVSELSKRSKEAEAIKRRA